MKTFRFPLQKALELRDMQLGLEEAKFQKAAATVAAADREREALLAIRADAEAEVRGAPTVAGEDLASLSAFQRHAEMQEKRILAHRAQCVTAMEAQRAVMLEARRALRLLERLKDKRKAEWNLEAAKEIEEMASESYLAQWSRDAATVK
jgi:flagellar export protein FliJ